MERAEADVCVVGAGFAGLAAARKLTQAGLSAVVLEARERVGGRAHTEVLADGTAIDHGGAWLGPGQDAAYGLAAELGIGTYPTYHKGANVFVKDGEAKRYRGSVPLAVGVLQLANLGIAMRRLDRMAGHLPLEAPWDAPRAAAWDAVTLATWIERNMVPGTGKKLLRSVLEDLYATDPAEVSLLYALYLIAAHRGLDRLFSTEGGDQQDRVAGGMQGIANRVAAELGDAVRLGQPVQRIGQTGSAVEVTGADVVVRARKAIVAVPVPLTARIAFDPSLPVDRAHLVQRMPIGTVTKIAAIYDQPWWRAEGLNATSVDADSPVSLTLDACAHAAPPGIIAAFVTGPASRAFGRLDPRDRRGVVTDALATRFGPKARALADYREHDWGAEDYSRGGYVAHTPPGALTGFGRSLREPVGAIHWAGTETATLNHGSFDGAIRSGLRAAAEVLASVQVPETATVAVSAAS
jgi:monoamine oxidase